MVRIQNFDSSIFKNKIVQKSLVTYLSFVLFFASFTSKIEFSLYFREEIKKKKKEKIRLSLWILALVMIKQPLDNYSITNWKDGKWFKSTKKMKVTLTTKELKIVDNGNNCRDFIFVISYSHFFVSYIHNKKHVFILTLIPNA